MDNQLIVNRQFTNKAALSILLIDIELFCDRKFAQRMSLSKILSFFQIQEQKVNHSHQYPSMQASNDKTISNFVQKAFHLLSIPDYNHIILWLPNGKEFLIRQPEMFEQTVLPKYFRHRNVHSFIRQLNMYGFQKCRKEPTKLIFSHPKFLRGKEELLPQVRRKIKQCKKQDNFSANGHIHYKPSQNPLVQVDQNLPTIMEDEDMPIATQKDLSKPITHQTIPTSYRGEDEVAIVPINSFFDLQVEDLQKQDLMLQSFMEIKPQMYLRMEEKLSMKEIGTEEFLGYKPTNLDIMSMYDTINTLATGHIKLFQSRNYLFQLDN